MKRMVLFVLCLFLSVPALAAFNVTTLQEFEQDVKNNLATEADPFHPDSVLDDFINMACRDVASYGVIIRVDSVVVASGGQVYGLNEDLLEVLAVFPCTTTESRGKDRIAFRDWGKIPGSTQLTATHYFEVQPMAYYDADTICAANIWLYAAHSGVADTLIVVYTAEAYELSADTDTTNIPYVYRPLVVMYATALAFARAQAYDKAAWWFAFYDQTLKQKLLFRKYQFDYMILPREIGK